MKRSTIKIISINIDNDKGTKALLPSMRNAIDAVSLKVHDAQITTLTGTLEELLDGLEQVVSKVAKSKGMKPSKITFSLGIDADGSVGILSTVAASVSHGASLAVEFDIKSKKSAAK